MRWVLTFPSTKRRERIIRHIQASEGVSEVLLLVDMGSLTTFGAALAQHCDVATRTIQLISTMHIVEAIPSAMNGLPLQEVYHNVLMVNQLLEQEVPRDREPAPARVPATTEKKLAIVMICTMGEGTAKVLENRLSQALSSRMQRVAVLSQRFDNDAQLNQELVALGQRYTLVALVSPFPIATALTQFDLADVLYYDGVTALDRLIERESTYLLVAETLTQILQHVKPDTALLAIKGFNARVSAALGITLSSNMLIGLTMHLACLLDRLLEGPTHSDFPDKVRYVQQHDAMIRLIRHELSAIEQAFSLAISEDEICTLCRFFISQDISQPTKEVINAYP
ncbi:hypothetical protein CS369_06020 [Candidatus Symbiopectobacterium sp. 'North America']|nr:hypothetical protein [Candidatus Symbiopectobacterium sp. 'North America']